MQPAVALTLVEMGRNLVDVPTAFNLERALVRLERLIAATDTGDLLTGHLTGAPDEFAND